MDKVKEFLISALKWVWQLPQNLLALCIRGVLYQSTTLGDKVEGNQIIWCSAFRAGMTLGDYIFLPPKSSKKTIKHECGHCRQSDILGPLYLIVIGIPSIVHNIIHTICTKHGVTWDYYSFYTEYWLMKAKK